MRILIVEDEPNLNRGIAVGLKDRGFAVDCAYDGVEGETLARMNEYDVILLDCLLPKRDGLTVCSDLRRADILTPIIFLTAKDSLEDKIQGLYQGADDYIVKPFSFEELVARIYTVLRRPRTVIPDVQELDRLRLDSRSHTIEIDGISIEATLREFSLLEYLLRNRGTVLSREDIQEHVWDRTFESWSNVVDVHLKNLRKKLPKHYAEKIEAIRGKGYRISE
jgi:DNA-binding response OmpR family regulator